MACQRCLRWQRHMRLSGKLETSTSRPFSTRSRLLEDAAAPQQEPELSILKHKRRPLRIPNQQSRSTVHNVDLSHRLGTKYSAPVIGAMEWQTSTYHYNKQTTRTYPVLANTTNRLIDQFAQLQLPKYDRDGKHDKKAPAMRRKEADKMFVSGTTARDYGSKMVIDFFIHDSKAASLEELRTRIARKRPAGGRKRHGRSGPAARKGKSLAPAGDVQFRTLSFGSQAS